MDGKKQLNPIERQPVIGVWKKKKNVLIWNRTLKINCSQKNGLFSGHFLTPLHIPYKCTHFFVSEKNKRQSLKCLVSTYPCISIQCLIVWRLLFENKNSSFYLIHHCLFSGIMYFKVIRRILHWILVPIAIHWRSPRDFMRGVYQRKKKNSPIFSWTQGTFNW